LNQNQTAASERLGFRHGVNGPHAARTMMFEDISRLFDHVPAGSAKGDYLSAVVDGNLLAKPTRKARELAARHLTALYGLDDSVPLFRALRRHWAADPDARPMLALLMSLARDPLLRGSQDFMLDQPIGAIVSREALEALLEKNNPERFSAASLKSFAQNVNGTWTSAGFLRGRQRKVRVNPVVTPVVASYALFVAYLQGYSGALLFSSPWLRLLGLPLDDLHRLASTAAQFGLLEFKSAGGVTEVGFRDHLTEAEMADLREANRGV